ncbi:uncharacterized protein BJ212DRAFT_1304005 [Suillus subaureus]|uniref:Uncharacterized protein n=1 Tax=Suillus subaureus TaxID=48587 RepID=A0A9P7DXT2_9AGAM|nr:uncharacterized protein BJ212DRAFT_1304005 [Suillus subaureus]KAG1805546.1 hypothetical protein BJ212DRAFT_1304005 [Suillus subaureus]
MALLFFLLGTTHNDDHDSHQSIGTETIWNAEALYGHPQLTTTFIFTSDGTPGYRPTQYRAYLVDPRFPKHADAQAAVCLQALSHGAGEYMCARGKAVEARVMIRSWGYRGMG